MKNIYFDYNATTPMDPEVIREMESCYGILGNPSSQHWAGRQTAAIIDKARTRVGNFIDIDSDRVIFTSGGTEANNLAILGAINAAGSNSSHLITTKAEHSSVLKVFEHLQAIGHDVTFLPVKEDGILDIKLLKDSLKENTSLISVHMANNETGVVQPVREIAIIASENGIPFHTDAVQAVGKIPTSMKDLGVDLLSLSGHKFHGPKGIGALCVAGGARVTPIFHGGGQEFGKRPGTENVPAIAALGKICEIRGAKLESEQKKLRNSRDRLETGLLKKIKNIRVNGSQFLRLPNTLNISFPGIPSEVMVSRLDLSGIAVSSGAACSSMAGKPSHVLKAMGLPFEIVLSAVRFSLGPENTDEEIDYCIDIIRKETQ